MTEIKVPTRVSELLKTIVENRHKEQLGTIQDFMVDVDRLLKYAILSHGGFLGIVDVLIPIPFDALMTGDEKGTALLDIDKQTLEKALSFESKKWPDFAAAYAAGSSQPQSSDKGSLPLTS
jgi:PRC-barrel domain